MKRTSIILLLLLLFISCSCLSPQALLIKPKKTPKTEIEEFFQPKLSKPRPPKTPERYGQYYTPESMIQYVRPVETRAFARQIKKDVNPKFKWDWTKIHTFHVVATWLNSQPHFVYRQDPDSIDLWRTPADTIRNRGGDCEDWAILVAALLRELGCPNPMRLIVGRTPGSKVLHAWISVTTVDLYELTIDSFPYSLSFSQDTRKFPTLSTPYVGAVLRMVEIP